MLHQYHFKSKSSEMSSKVNICRQVIVFMIVIDNTINLLFEYLTKPQNILFTMSLSKLEEAIQINIFEKRK